MKFLVSSVHPIALRLAMDEIDTGLKEFYSKLVSLPVVHVKPELERIMKIKGLTVYKTGADYARSFFPMEKVGWVPDYNYTDDINKLLAKLDVRGTKFIMDEIHKSIEQGLGPPVEKLAPKLGYDTAKAVARTVLMNVYAKGALLQWHRDGIEHVKRLAVEDLKTCPVCRGLNGKEYAVGDLILMVNPQSFDTHENCLVGETMVLAPGASRGRIGLYQGPGVKIVFEGGNVTCTANHMFLTSKGFSRASSLREGDDILYSPIFERPSVGNPNYDGKPSPIEDVVAALSKSSSMSRRRVPVASEDLHGDGAFFDSDIDVVAPNSLGWNADDPFGLEFGDQQIFSGTSSSQGFSAKGDLASMLFALRDASDGGMGLRSESEFFLGRHARHPDFISIASRADSGSSFYQPIEDPMSSQIEFDGQAQNGFSSFIHRSQLGNIDISSIISSRGYALKSSSDLYASSNQMPSNSIAFDSQFLAKCQSAFSGKVTLRKILNVQRKALSCHVYDLQTQSSLYLANGLVSSNCRCTFIPIINISTYAPKKDKMPLTMNIKAGDNEAEDVPIEYAAVLQEMLGRSRLPFKVKFDAGIKADYERRNGTLVINPKALADEDPRDIIYQEEAETLWLGAKEKVEKEYAPMVRAGFAKSAKSWDDDHELFVNNFTAYKLGQLDNDLWSQVFFRSIER
jgi:hypothetical protein